MYIDNNVKNVLSDIEARAKGGSLLIFAHQHQHYITHILWLGKKSRNPRSYFFKKTCFHMNHIVVFAKGFFYYVFTHLIALWEKILLDTSKSIGNYLLGRYFELPVVAGKK